MLTRALEHARMGGDREKTRVAIVVVALGVGGFLIGHGSSQLVASSLFEPRPAEEAHSSEALAPSEIPDGCALIEGHQVFDSALHLACDEAPSPPEGAGEGESESEGEVGACEAPTRLVGVYVRRDRPEESIAAITTAGSALLYREGMPVGDRSVVAIRESSVVLARATGERCALTMFEPDAPGPPLATAGDDVVVTAPTASAHVERLGETHFAIDRSYLEDAIVHQAWASARVIPQPDGMRVFGVRRDSVLGQLGIQNGDAIRTVNGFDVTDPLVALEALPQLRGAEHLTVSLVRRGRSMAIEYDVR